MMTGVTEMRSLKLPLRIAFFDADACSILIAKSIIGGAGSLRGTNKQARHGQVLAHIHDQEIEISERFYLDPLT
jgi:hypothetical protein